jgi:hypothetical protein
MPERYEVPPCGHDPGLSDVVEEWPAGSEGDNYPPVDTQLMGCTICGKTWERTKDA